MISIAQPRGTVWRRLCITAVIAKSRSVVWTRSGGGSSDAHHHAWTMCSSGQAAMQGQSSVYAASGPAAVQVEPTTFDKSMPLVVHVESAMAARIRAQFFVVHTRGGEGITTGETIATRSPSELREIGASWVDTAQDCPICLTTAAQISKIDLASDRRDRGRKLSPGRPLQHTIVGNRRGEVAR
jgi:hypothetical protein